MCSPPVGRKSGTLRELRSEPHRFLIRTRIRIRPCWARPRGRTKEHAGNCARNFVGSENGL
eukprot:290521-Alexandrium_andersonii.AAC.1